MLMLKSFLSQPVTAYRDFQIVFTLLTLNFAIPTLSYAFFPDVAMANFSQLNTLLGGGPYTVAENTSHFWRYLGTANVASLAFMCFLIQLDIKRFGEVVVPLSFLKATAATLWLAGWLQHPEYPAFGAAALLDYGTTAAFLIVVLRARRAVAASPDATLIPRPTWS
jgi:hypothetical protein